jgi:putative sterol carrier protein
VYTLDLKNGSGSMTNKAADKADIIITISDDDFVALAAGTLNAQQAFMSGKIKVKGNMGLAMKLNTVMAAAKPKAKL